MDTEKSVAGVRQRMLNGGATGQERTTGSAPDSGVVIRTGRNETHCPSFDYGGIMAFGSIQNLRTLASVYYLLTSHLAHGPDKF